jgi:hypothetical protein
VDKIVYMAGACAEDASKTLSEIAREDGQQQPKWQGPLTA